ncbi:AAA family ATPase [Chloroflexota bacterium]
MAEQAVNLVCMGDVEAETVSWLCYPYIPQGKLTLLEGDPGVGKSWLSLAIATAVSIGKGLPGMEATESATVVLASAEDGLGDTIRPRLDAMGADARNIHAIKGALDFGTDGLVRLEGFIREVKPTLVIIDPLVAYIGAGVDFHRANETRGVMAQLADIAERHSTAILAVRHLTKGSTSKPIYRGLGSIDITAACRSVLLAGCDPDNPQERGLVHIKSNLAPMGAAIGYEMRDGTFHWTGESDLTAARILSVEDGEGKSAIDEAIEFLKGELDEGPVEAKQVFSDARTLFLSEKTIKRAKRILGIISRRQGETGKRGGGKFVWELPDSHLEAQKDLEGQEGHIEYFGPLNPSSFGKADGPTEVGPLNTEETDPESVLGVPINRAIEIWRSLGAPVIHLGWGKNCFDLEKLLLYTSVPEKHLLAIRHWLDKVMEGL